MLQNNNVHTKVDSYTADSCYNSQKNGLAFTKKKKNDQKFASPSAAIQVPKGSFLGEPPRCKRIRASPPSELLLCAWKKQPSTGIIYLAFLHP